MQRSKKFLIIISVFIIIFITAFIFYKYIKYSNSNKLLNESSTLMQQEKFDEASEKIKIAKKEYPNNKNIPIYEKDLEYNIEAEKIYNEGLLFNHKGDLEKALSLFKTINPQAKEVKDNANKLIKDLEDKLISSYVKDAKNYISKNNFPKATEFINKISNINNNDKTISSLKKELSSKKESVINSYKENFNQSINKKNFSEARNYIDKLEYIDNSNSNIKSLNNILNEALESEKFSKNKYIGFGNDVKTETFISPYIGKVTLLTSEYNPNIVDNKTFIDFYYKKIKPYLNKNVRYDLINIKNRNRAIVFVGIPNENEEFMKGQIDTEPNYNKGSISLDDNNAVYCGIHGENIISFIVGTVKEVPFNFY